MLSSRAKAGSAFLFRRFNSAEEKRRHQLDNRPVPARNVFEHLMHGAAGKEDQSRRVTADLIGRQIWPDGSGESAGHFFVGDRVEPDLTYLPGWPGGRPSGGGQVNGKQDKNLSAHGR